MTQDDTSGETAPHARDAASTVDPFEGPDWESRRRVRRSRSTSSTSSRHGPPPSRRRRRKRSHRKRWAIGIGVLALAIVAIGAWLAYTGLRARAELNAVRSEVHELRAEIDAGDLTAARTTAGILSSHARQAHDLTTGPLWAGAAAIPLVGDPMKTVRAVTSSIDTIATGALPSLIHASKELDPSSLRRPDGSFDLAPIKRIAPEMSQAAATMQAALARIVHSPTSTWFSGVDSERRTVLDQLQPLSRTVVNASIAAKVAPAMLGADGPRTYFVAFENEAELRGVGGLPGAFGILRADRGKLAFTRFEPDNVLVNTPSGVNFGRAYNDLYLAAGFTNRDIRQSDVSPNFPYAAQIWLHQWQQYSGQRVDGAVALDPTALSYLLKVSGPVKVRKGFVVSADNVVKLTENTAYVRFGTNNTARKRFILGIARSASVRVLRNSANATALVRAAARAVSERRLLVWSSDSDIEQSLASTPIAGVVPQTKAPYFGVAINNVVGTKLDYYLRGAVQWQRSGCGSTRNVTISLRLTNAAPPGLPQSLLGLTTRRGYPATDETDRVLSMFTATAGAGLQSITINGRRALSQSGTELGHPVFSQILYVPRGQTVTVVLHLVEPAASGPVTTRIQPMVTPLRVSMRDQSCS